MLRIELDVSVFCFDFRLSWRGFEELLSTALVVAHNTEHCSKKIEEGHWGISCGPLDTGG